MSLLTPFFLWGLAALIPLGLIYLMKTKPRKRVTNALFLWEKVLEEKSSHFALKKLRNFWSLLLMALVFALAVFSLTNPQWSEKQQADLIVIIDSSISMRAKDGSTSRFEKATNQVSNWLKSTEGGARMALATADSDIRYHCNLTSNTKSLKEALKKLKPSQSPLSKQAFSEISILQDPSDKKGSCRVLFLTDGSHNTGSLPESIEVIHIQHDETPNFGITAADIALLPQGKAKVFFTIVSSALVDTSLEVELTHLESDHIAKLISVTVPAQSSYSEFIEVDGMEAGLWSIKLSQDDPFLEDNQVIMGLNIPSPIGVAIDVSKPYFYHRCIEAFNTAENLLEILPVDKADVVISETTSKYSRNIIFAPKGGSPYWSNIGEELDTVIATEKVKDHPLTKHLNIDNISFAGAKKLQAPKGSLIILHDISGTPLLYESIQNGDKVIVANFQPEYDDFYLSPWFPVIIHNAARYLSGRKHEMPIVVQSGSTITLPTQAPLITQNLYPLHSSEFTTAEVNTTHSLDQLGGYSYQNTEQKLFTGAAVLSLGESSQQRLDNTNLENTEMPSSGWPLAWWLLLIAIIFAIVEEALYHRRKVG